jgi:hypothetical protein
MVELAYNVLRCQVSLLMTLSTKLTTTPAQELGTQIGIAIKAYNNWLNQWRLYPRFRGYGRTFLWRNQYGGDHGRPGKLHRDMRQQIVDFIEKVDKYYAHIIDCACCGAQKVHQHMDCLGNPKIDADGDVIGYNYHSAYHGLFADRIHRRGDLIGSMNREDILLVAEFLPVMRWHTYLPADDSPATL